MQAPLIIGGGPAGAAAAALLARAGQAVTLLERSVGPTDKVCGDFLSADAIALARRLGVDPADLGAATLRVVRLVHGRRLVETPLPFPALGLTRRRFDEALLEAAAACGAEIRRGHVVRSVTSDPSGVLVAGAPPGMGRVGNVFLATGKHDLHGLTRPGRLGGPIGMKMYYRLAAQQLDALRGCIELMLFSGGYAGLQCVEADHAVLCVLVQRTVLRDCGGQWHRLLATLTAESPHLLARLDGATALLPQPLAVAGLPYGYRHDPVGSGPANVFRLGDQTAVIASLTGDGVAIALASGVLAAETWLQGGDAGVYHRRLAQQTAVQMRVAGTLHRLCLVPALQPWILRLAGRLPGIIPLAARWTRLHGTSGRS